MSARSGLSPSELKRRIELERAGRAFLECRELGASPEIYELPASGRVTIGRGDESDLTIAGDEKISRLHAELERIGGSWVITDDGLSRNGTWMGEERVSGRRRLEDGDVFRIGASLILFRAPGDPDARTAAATGDPELAQVTEAQRRVLVALCRPFRDGSEFAVPATNKEIAAEVYLSVEAVKSHLRALFERFEIGDLPQNQKRLKLVENALRSGVVSPRELRDQPFR